MQTHTIYYHYTATVVPFIFLATAHSFYFFKKNPAVSYGSRFFLSLTICLFSIIQHRQLLVRMSLWADELDPFRWQMAKTIPAPAAAVATFDFLAELSQRPRLYSLHNVWRNNNPFTGENLTNFPMCSTL